MRMRGSDRRQEMMRSVSFVDRLEFEFPGNHSSHGLCLGDVNGDGLNELVIGSVDGVLAVFKGDKSTKPWRKCSDLGMITSVAVGDILNQKKNLVICSTAEGVCHIFDFHQNQQNSGRGPPAEDASKTGTGMRPFHSQYLSLNIKTLLVACIDSGGTTDVFVGYTDRAVGAYRWDLDAHSLIPLTDRLPLNGQVGSLSVGVASVPGLIGGCGQLLVSQAGGTCVPLVYSSGSHTHQNRDGTGARNENGTKTGMEATTEQHSGSCSVKLTYQKGSIDGVIGVVQRRNPIVGTEIVGNITPAPQSTVDQSSSASRVEEKGRGKDEEMEPCGTLTALCTLDGSMKLLKDENKQWELQVDHSLFSLHRLDITWNLRLIGDEHYHCSEVVPSSEGSGGDEIAGAAWDGMTYIVDQKRNVVKFHFGENICAFSAGEYGYEGSNVPCLVYTTFHGQIFIYHNVTLPSIPSTSMLQALSTVDFPEELREKWDLLTDEQKRTRIRGCLYSQS